MTFDEGANRRLPTLRRAGLLRPHMTRWAVSTLVVCFLSTIHAATLRVDVVDENGTALADTLVRLTVDDGIGDAGKTVRSDDAGVALFEELLPGHFLLTLDAAETAFVRPEDTFPTGTLPISVRDPAETLATTLALHRGKRVQLRFTVDGSELRHWGTVVAINLDTSQRVSKRIDQDDDRVLALVPGRWNLTLVPPPGLLLSELRIDGQAVGGHQVNVNLAAAPATPQIDWHFTAPARVTGHVRFNDLAGDAPPVKVRASLLRPGPWFNDARRRGGSDYTSVSAAVDPATGRFMLELPGGRWHLEAHDDLGRSVGTPTHRVDLQAGEEQQVDFEWVKSDSLDGNRSHQEPSDPSPMPPWNGPPPGEPQVTGRLYCQNGERLPRRVDVRVFAGQPGAESTAPALSLEAVPLTGDMRDQVVAGPLGHDSSLLTVRPAGFDRWTRVPFAVETTEPVEPTELGAIEVDCEPRLRVSVEVASGLSAPDLRGWDDRSQDFQLEGTVRTADGDVHEVKDFQLEPFTGEVFVRGLPAGEAALSLRLGHPLFLPEYWIEVPVDGMLTTGRTLDITAVVKDLGSAIVVRARGPVAARLIAEDGVERRYVFHTGRVVLLNLPAASYQLDICGDAACQAVLHTWSDVVIYPLETLSLAWSPEPQSNE